MTRANAKALLPVMSAWANGAEIQYRGANTDKWNDVGGFQSWDDDPCHYRVKPKPLELFLIERDGVLLLGTVFLDFIVAWKNAACNGGKIRRFVEYDLEGMDKWEDEKREALSKLRSPIHHEG